MSALTVYEMLQNEIKMLPEALAEKVFDLFAQARRAKETFLWKQVKETRAYRARHPEDVTTVKAEDGTRIASA
jgi:hypothetical protein